MQYPCCRMERTQVSVVISFHAGKCLQRAGGDVRGCVGISADWMSYLMFRFAVIATGCGLLLRFGSVRLLFIVRHIRCLPLRFLLEFLIRGVRAVALIVLRALLVCGADSPTPGSCPLFLNILKNVVHLGIEETNSIKWEVFNACTRILN